MHLVDQIKEKARKNLQTVVLPESYDERMLFAAEKIVKEGLAKIVILGDLAKIQADASARGINLAGVELLNPAASPKLEQYVADLVELRKSKGLTADEARKLLTADDNLYYAGMMVRNGDAGGEVAGATGTTGNVLKAAFQTVGPAKGIKTVSSFFLMITKTPTFGENGIILFADCAVNPNPDAQALAAGAGGLARRQSRGCGQGHQSSGDRQADQTGYPDRRGAPGRCRTAPQGGRKEGPRQPGGRQGQRPDLPGPGCRQHRLQAGGARSRGRGGRTDHPGSGQTGQ